jgi:hypothetical protein
VFYAIENKLYAIPIDNRPAVFPTTPVGAPAHQLHQLQSAYSRQNHGSAQLYTTANTIIGISADDSKIAIMALPNNAFDNNGIWIGPVTGGGTVAPCGRFFA